MPILIKDEKNTGYGYQVPFLDNLNGNVIHVPIDVSILTTSQVDSDGYVKPGVVVSRHGGAVGAGAGTAQVETATIVGTVTTAGNAKVTITSAAHETPLAVPVAVASTDTASQVATKVRAALSALTQVTDYFTVGGASADVILTAKTNAGNDTTLNIASANDTSAGLTAAPTSANTTPGVAPDEACVVVSPARIAHDNTSLAGVTNDPFVQCCPGPATIVLDLAKANLGRSYLPAEITALKAAGFKLV